MIRSWLWEMNDELDIVEQTICQVITPLLTQARNIIPKADDFSVTPPSGGRERSQQHRKFIWGGYTLSSPSLVVAYSGGKDSHVLLHALYRLKHHFKQRFSFSFHLQAFHVHHGLSAFASEWAKHCENVCKRLEIPLEVFHAQIDKQAKDSLEELARQARYQLFRQAIQQDDILLTAHTEEDQTETVLMHLLRGTGLQGLAGIHPKHVLGKGWLVRPLLEVNREAIFRYAQQHRLQWVEDDSNNSLVFRRNLIRHTVFPLLNKINPSFSKQVSSCARLAHETQSVLDDYVRTDLAALVDDKGLLLLSGLMVFSLSKQKALLRGWIKQQGAVLPSEKKLLEIIRQMLAAKTDKIPCVKWGNSMIRRYQNKLYLTIQVSMDDPSFNTKSMLLWDYHHPLVLSSKQIWQAEPQLGQGINFSKLTSAVFEVRFRQTGESVKMPGKQHHTKLKTLFQNLKIPPWEREHIPIVYQDDMLIAIGDYWVSEEYRNLDNLSIGLTIKRKVN